MTEPNVLGVLARFGADPLSGVYLRPPCNAATIEQLRTASKRDLGEAVPEPFLRLLGITNGVQINGAYFKEVEHLVADNLDFARPEVIVLGSEGNMAQFVFDRRDRRFHTINMGSPDERFASFDTFDEMLLAVLREQCVL